MGPDMPRDACFGCEATKDAMEVGAYIFTTASSISPIEFGEALEAHGYESLFLPEHTHIPTSRKTPYRWGESSRGTTPRPTTRSSRSPPSRR